MSGVLRQRRERDWPSSKPTVNGSVHGHCPVREPSRAAVGAYGRHPAASSGAISSLCRAYSRSPADHQGRSEPARPWPVRQLGLCLRLSRAVQREGVQDELPEDGWINIRAWQIIKLIRTPGPRCHHLFKKA